MNKATYVEKLRGMLATDGWRECWRPRLEQLKQMQVDYCCAAPTWEQTLAARQGLILLDTILSLEAQVDRWEKELKEAPDEAGDVVDLSLEAQEAHN